MSERRNAIETLRDVTKYLALPVGLGLTLVSAMALAGHFVSPLWARIALAAVGGIGLPLLVVNRFVPDDPDVDTYGLPTDILAVVWLALGVTFLVPAYGATRPMLLREGDRLASDGYEGVARGVWWLAGTRGVARTPARRSVDASRAGSAPEASAPETAADDTAHSDAGVASDRPELTPAQIFRTLAPAVVNISVQEHGERGGGTGFFVSADGVIATNYHVIQGATSIEVRTFDNTALTVVEVLTEDPAEDLALLRVRVSASVTPAPLGDSDRAVVGERVVSIGNPLGLEYTLTDGLVSARRVWNGRPMIQMSAPVSPGNSGGPLFNARGEVIGVTTARAGSTWARGENLNLAVPINLVRRLIQPNYPARRVLGSDASAASRW